MMAQRNRDVLLVLDDSAQAPLYRQIYDQMRLAIASGTLAEGDRLPSIRRCADELRVSHTTVEQAYLQLSIEGYVTNVPRSGYLVKQVDTKLLITKKQAIGSQVKRAVSSRNTDAFYAENVLGKAARFDFSYANLQPHSFPAKIWRQLVNDVLYANSAPQFDCYSYTDEPNALSVELARYLGQARGIDCLPQQVVPQAGTDGALATILQLFDPARHVIGLEEPGYATIREVAERMGFRLVSIPTDCGAHAFIAALQIHNPKIVFTTPSHQFPTGAVLGLEARGELLKWARATNAYVIEDDSCNEYRYNTHPIPSLQSLDAHNRVIYLGNFSKVLSPALRVAYLVLPPKLLGRYYRLFNYAHPTVPLLELEVLARFIREGYYSQHIRRMSLGNKKRHDALLKCLEDEFGNRLGIQGAHAGMHLFVTVENNMEQEQLLASALDNGAAVYGTKRFWFSKPAPKNKLMLGFSAISLCDIPAGVNALRRAWFGV